MSGCKYSDSEITYVLDNVGKLTHQTIANNLSAMYGNKRTKQSVSELVRRLGKAKTTKHHHFTNEEKQWLVQYIHACDSYIHLTEMFNKQFGLNVKVHSISDVCIKQLGVHRDCCSSRFTKGTTAAKTYKIGDETEYNGYTWIKIKDNRHEGTTEYRDFKQNWMPKYRYIYEQAHGPIPEGYIVIFLNKNHTDYSIDNLYAIPRNIHQMMCKNNWYTDSKLHTLTAIRYCELFYAIKDNK